nr:histone-lysine N-methyltransferase set-26-like isoform X2 [Cherax quadricarinatus]
MSLVVHKLVLSPGGATTNTQPPTHHVTLSAYTHTRSNVSNAMGRVLDGPSSGSMSTPLSSSSPYSSSSSSSSSSKHSSTYNLPFVLQDHNYGAPPPPTPPQSPPPLPSSSGSSVYQQSSHQFHQSHHQHSPQPHQLIHSQNLQSHPPQNTNVYHHHHHHPQHRQQSHNHPQHVSPSHRLGIITSSSPSLSLSGLLTSHPLNTMPPHRQQFMPHPKTSIFPSPHIPPPPVELHQSPTAITGLPSSVTGAETDDDSRMSDRSSSVGPSGEETETAPEGEGDDQPIDDSITRCVCDFSHDDGYMIQCDRCFVWQHVDCMEIDRDNIPDEYLCEACDPRSIDRFKARALQIRRRQEIKAHIARMSSSDSDDNIPMSGKGRGNLGKIQEKKVVKKKKVKQMKDIKNGRKGSLSLLKKTSLVSPGNNNVIPGTEDKERRMLVKRRVKCFKRYGSCVGWSILGFHEHTTLFFLSLFLLLLLIFIIQAQLKHIIYLLYFRTITMVLLLPNSTSVPTSSAIFIRIICVPTIFSPVSPISPSAQSSASPTHSLSEFTVSSSTKY